MEKQSIGHLENIDKDLLCRWIEVLDTIKQYSNKLVNDCFFSIRVKLMVKILNQISKENKLSKYDEKIFEYFHHLMWYYYQTINLYEQNKEAITNPKVKDIMDGICTVLSSQLNQFEENQQNEYIYMDRITTRNPIRIEKDEIISKAKNKVLKSMSFINDKYNENQSDFCYNYVILNIFNSRDSHLTYITLLDDIYKGIINNTIDLLYQTYIEITMTSIEKINNLQFRKAANFYYESIKQEKENLEIIIKVQINALEDELKNMNIEVLEHQKINQILDTLIEAYQHLGREIESLAAYFKEIESASKEINLLNKEQFVDYIVNEGSKKYIQDLSSKEFPNDIKILNDKINETKLDFEFELNKTTKEIIDYKLVCFNKANDIKNEVDNFIKDKTAMTNEFLECFIYIKNYYDENKESLFNTSYSDIFKGIYETIEIKIESLSENRDMFLETLYNVSNNLSFNITDQNKEKIQADILQLWYNKHPFSKKEFIDLLESIYNTIEQHEIILKYKNNVKKQKDLKLNQINKSYINFLKDSLLFELTTYEEILNYSISRLRQTDIEIVNDFVKVIDEVSSKIDKLLLQYNIETIKPNPYDLFDGKEHEILMAEKNKDFEKGQIIKLMNTGYKYNNAVIIRANVIAAK